MKNYLLLFSILISTQLFAQNNVVKNYNLEETQSSGDGKYTYKVYKNDPLKSRWYTLQNGLSVILSVNTSKPRIQTYIATKAGSKNDPKENTGLAHYLEHMLFKGTDKYGTLDFAQEHIYLTQIDQLYEDYNQEKDEAKRKKIYHSIDSVSGIAAKYAIANEYDKMLQSIGASGTNAFTSFEQTVYVNDIPSNEINKWLDIEAERFRFPILRLFHTELEAVYEEKNRTLDNDGRKMLTALFENLYRNHNYGQQTTIGTVEHLKNPSLTKIREYYESNYVPNNMAIILSGDFNPDEVIKAIDEKFSYMTPRPVEKYEFIPEVPRDKPVHVDVYGPDAEFVYIGYRLPGAGTREASLLRVCDLLLSNSNAGLIDLDLVKSQKVLSAYANPYILKDYSTHFLYGKAKEGQSLDEVRDLLLNELDKLKKGDFDYEMVKSIVQNNKVESMRQFEENRGRASELLEYFVLGVNYQYALKLDEEMLSFSKDDLMNFAKKYYSNDYVVCYKHKGKDTTIQKIDKPLISKVEVNRDAVSPFVDNILKAESKKLQPRYLDFNKDLTKLKLKNGVEAFYVKNEINGLFTLYYVLEAGKYNDLKLAFAVNYLPYLGTSKYSADQIATEFYKLACDYGVSVGDKQSYVYLSGLNENFEKSLLLFEELLADAQPNEEALKNLVARTLKSRQDAKLNKNTILFSALRNYVVYGPDNPFRYNLDETALNALTGKELCNYIHNLVKYQHRVYYYGPDESKKVVTILNSRHNSISKKLELPPFKEFKKRDITANEVYFTNYDMVQAEIAWYRKLDQVDRSKDPVVTLFNEYFGGGMSSLVFQTIRESKALAYSTFSSYIKGSEPGEYDALLAYVGAQADKLNDAIPAMNELLNDLPQSDKLIENCKTGIKSQLESKRVVGSSILFAYDNALKWGYKEDPDKVVYDNIDKLTFSDLKNFHAKYYSNKPYNYFLIANKEKIKLSDLSKYGTLKELSLEEIFGY
ncbi:MAG: insulinase family protein [Flavobacteriales bacterium]|nr:insulinase family protein [Flavobacteriales bacterium]